jgi:ligand-binding sensor domain-containing protein
VPPLSRTFGAVLALLSALLAMPPTAAGLPTDYRLTQFTHDVWSARRGAPFQAALAIAQTSDGYLWIATDADGLLRFDGIRFRRAVEFDALVGPGSRISRVEASADGSLWVASNRGLARFAVAKWTIAVPTEDVSDVAVREDGGIYTCVSGKGLFLWRQGGSEQLNTDSRDCWYLAAGTGDEVWQAFSPEHLDGILRRREGQTTLFSPREGLSTGTVAALHFGRSRSLWVATRNGLSQVRDGKVKVVLARREDVPGDELTAVVEDRDGAVWAGTIGNGIVRIAGGRVERFGKQQGLPEGAVMALFEDREGSLWVASQSGLSRFKAGPATPWGQPEGLGLDRVTSVLESRDGSIWMWSDGGGLSRLKEGRVQVYTTKDGLASNFGGPLYEAKDGAIWIGHDRGLSRFKDGGATGYRKGPIGSGYVPMITEDAEGIITYVRGMGLVRFRDGEVVPYHDRDRVSHEPLPMPYSALWAKDGALWLPTGEGLWVLRGAVLRKAWLAPTGTPVVFSAHQAADGALWFSTGQGLYRMKQGKMAAITVAQGLPDEMVGHMLEDDQGFAWLGTSHAVLRVRKQELEDLADGPGTKAFFESFGMSEGARIAGVNPAAQPSATRARDGRLWFATRAGAIVIDAAHLRRNTAPPPVVIEDLLVDGQSAGAGPDLRLPPGTTRIEMLYTAASLVAPEKVRFRYRLVGFDPGWVEAGSRRIASYMNLAPRSYHFQVMAVNNDGVPSDHGAALAFRQLPHIYQTTWFAGLLVVAALSLSVGAHRYRLRRHLRLEAALQARIQEALAQIKTLSGLFPICAWCKRVREDGGYWKQIETYVSEHSQAEFSHGICPDCLKAQRAALRKEPQS